MGVPLISMLGLLLVAICGWLTLAGDLTGAGVPSFALLQFAAAGVLLLSMLFAIRPRGPDAPPAGGDERESTSARKALWVILAVALAARAVLLFATPSLSADCYRYVWEGRVTAAGHNPYALAPDHPTLEPLRDADWERINHREVPAIYGPVLQLLFAGLSLLGGGLLAFKLTFVAADLGLAALVFRQLARQRASPFWLLVYLWHPLVLLEVAGQGHLEVLPVALMFLALDLEARGRSRAAALALGAAVASKYLPALIVPAFVLSAVGWRARGERLALVALPGVLALLPFLAAGEGPSQGLSAYGSTWRFNDGGFWLLDRALESLGISQAFCRSVLPAFVQVDPGFDPADHTTWMRIPPKLLVGLIVVAVIGWASRPRAGRVDLERAAFLAAACFLLLSPTVHPWYALWLLPFLPARAAAGAPGAPAWLLLTLLLPLSYAATVGPAWEDRLWVRALEYAPFLLLYCYGWVRVRA